MRQKRRQPAAPRALLRTVLALGLGVVAAQNVAGLPPTGQVTPPDFETSPAVEAMMAQVQPTALSPYVAQLTGESPALVGGVPSWITSRHTVSSGGGIQLATQYAYEHLQSLGLPVRYHDWSGCGSNPTISSRNVVGELTGVSRPDEVVIIMAHLDSRPAGPLSFGADDDASGSAGVLMAADILSQHRFRRTIRFVLTTGEEQGLCGSAAYAAVARARDENVVAVCNLDMIGWDSTDGPTLRLHIRTPDRPGHADDLAIANVFTGVVGAYGLNLIPNISADYSYTLRNADQVNFWDSGYPAILAIEDTQDDFNSTNYHTLNDRLETLNLRYMTDFVKASVGTMAHLAYPAASTVELTVLQGGASSTATAGARGSLQTGFAVGTVASGATPYGVAVFASSQDGVVVSESAVPPSPPTTAARVFVEYRSAVSAVLGGAAAAALEVGTGLALVNPGSAAANVTLTLRDSAGATIAVGRGTVAGGAHLARFVHQLKDVAPDFDLAGDFPIVTRFCSLELASDRHLSVLALRLTVNQRHETLLTTTPIADLTRPLESTPLFFPQLADGGGFVTTIVLLNTSNEAETGKLQLYGDKGGPLEVSRIAGTRASEFAYSIQPGGVFVFQTDGAPPGTNTGWARLIPDPGTSSPVGAGVIGFSQAGVLVTESGVVAARPTAHARIYIDQSGGHATGLAVANPDRSRIDITLRPFSRDGSTPVGTSAAPMVLEGNGHAAAFVHQLVSGLPSGFTGVLDLSSSSPFIALTLRSLTNSRGDFLLTTFPVADATRPASAPVIFPQIADGGGYLTEFILLSAEGPSRTILRLYGEDGSPLDVAK